MMTKVFKVIEKSTEYKGAKWRITAAKGKVIAKGKEKTESDAKDAMDKATKK